ncbi:hypothetical protein MHC_03960 [Mycoplasma haemocanis str. Illinois]|uniref:Uncharacterized protein n=1 Tax=Mycoplasma haemocanis (strain Illinois) TaxID=1111676 RepID=H6N7M8_MYCHN|nr:hypothetical protein [Mycoplasma haemocanis]AEW45650.1 hypothetical protein MHC_03960 [Mycoplasma haemocanis str. Illinois]
MFLLNAIKCCGIVLTTAIVGNNLINKLGSKKKILVSGKSKRPNVYTKRLDKSSLVKLDDNYFSKKENKCTIHRIDSPTKNKASIIESFEFNSLVKKIKDKKFLKVIHDVCNKGSKNVYIYRKSHRWIYEEQTQRHLLLNHNSKMAYRIR